MPHAVREYGEVVVRESCDVLRRLCQC